MIPVSALMILELLHGTLKLKVVLLISQDLINNVIQNFRELYTDLQMIPVFVLMIILFLHGIQTPDLVDLLKL
jgi:hypothetical protein